MQSDWKELYKITSARTGIPENTYKEIGNFVFRELYKKLKRPESLITKLKGVGTWYLRKQRMEIMIDQFPPNFDKKPEDFNSDLELLKHENKIEIYNLFKHRLEEYNDYLEIKEQIKKIRHESQPPLVSPTEET